MINNLKNFKRNRNGFTLAEVLITLVIIGIVAAMTIPTMVNNTNKEELRAGLLKAQTTVANALELFYSKNGYKLTPVELAYSSTNRVHLYKLIKPYLSVSKDCGTGSCVSNTGGTYKTYDGSRDMDHTVLDDGQLILNNGMTLFVEHYTGNIYVSVDVNGHEKKPNKVGHDLFFFQLTDEGNLIPMGAEGTDYPSDTYCVSSSTSKYNGMGCTAKALKEADYFKKLPK